MKRRARRGTERAKKHERGSCKPSRPAIQVRHLAGEEDVPAGQVAPTGERRADSKNAMQELARYAPLTAALLPAGLAFVAALASLLGWFSMNVPSWLLPLDTWLYLAILSFKNENFTSIIFTFLNDPGIDYTIPIVICLAYVWMKRRNDMVGAAAAVALTLIVDNWTLQFTYQFGFRPRPFNAIPELPTAIAGEWRQTWSANPTFPSGHMRELTSVAVVLSYYWRQARWPVALFATFIAYTRLYLGAHYPTDVLAGVLIGLSTGGFSVFAVQRMTRLVALLGQAPRVRGAYEYVFPPTPVHQQALDPTQARAVRTAVALVSAFAGTLILGSLVFISSPPILANYLLNANSSLVFPLFNRFNDSLAQVLYSLLGNPWTVYPALLALTLGYAARRGRRRLGAPALAVLVAFALAQALALLFAARFHAPRPLTAGVVPLADVWLQRWAGPATFPDPFLTTVMALCATTATLWRRVVAAAYAYAFGCAITLLYLGAAWPFAAVASLLVGYLAAKAAFYVTSQVLPAIWTLGNDDAQSGGEHSAGDWRGAKRLAVRVGRER